MFDRTGLIRGIGIDTGKGRNLTAPTQPAINNTNNTNNNYYKPTITHLTTFPTITNPNNPTTTNEYHFTQSPSIISTSPIAALLHFTQHH
jgi:hypothetical protein